MIRRALVSVVVFALATIGLMSTSEASTRSVTSVSGWSVTASSAAVGYTFHVPVTVKTGTHYEARTVHVQRARYGSTSWADVATGRTSSTGKFTASLSVPSVARWAFRLVVSSTTTASGYTSPSRTITGIAGAVTTVSGWSTTASTGAVGYTFRVPVRVKTGTRFVARSLVVQRATYGKTNWATVSSTATNSSGSATVSVPLSAAGKWSYRLAVVPTISAAGYTSASRVITAVAKPIITSLSANSATPDGGSSLTITGANLTPTPSVTFGGEAASVVSATSTKISVVVPPGLPGSAPVVVRTAGGASAPASFNYVMPAAGETSSYSPLPTTMTAGANDVQWVTGGPDPSDLAGTQQNPWVISLAPDAPVPAVGDGYLIKPGGTVAPAGLAGAVASLAAQQDGTTRVTLTPAPLDQILQDASVSYTGDTSAASSAVKPGAATTAPALDLGSATFPKLNSSAFDCENGIGDAVSFDGSVSLTFTRFEPVAYFYMYPKPNFGAYVTGTVVVSGSISASESMSCKLNPLWADAHRRVIPLGDTGATLSVGPTATLSLTTTGTAKISQTTRFMYGITKDPNDPPELIHIARSQSTDFSLNANVTANVSAGISLQVGVLDRIGAELKGKLYAKGSLTAPIVSTNPQSCTQLTFGFSIGINAYLDALVARWESPSFSHDFDFTPVKECVSVPPTVPPTADPAITSSTLPDAQVGSAYSSGLTTADGRTGTWSLTGGALPPGLTLESDGTVDGTPSSGVGAWYPVVTFTDDSGLTATATLFLTVDPSPGLGGGAIQATLTWNSPADLDLHALEPDGNEIYYANPGPSADGGQLDHDANAGCSVVDPAPAENIHWPAGEAEMGTYNIWVQTYDTCGTSDLSWHLVVRVNGAVVLDTTGSDTSQEYSINYGAGSATVTKHPLPSGKLTSLPAKAGGEKQRSRP